jgi:hypothetical protein
MTHGFSRSLFATPSRSIGLIGLIGLVTLASILLLPALASADPCDAVEGPPGTVTLPPAGCDYLSPDQVHMIVEGLPPGTTLELDVIHKDFICGDRAKQLCSVPLGVTCEAPGGNLGGNVDCSDTTAEITVTGTGALAGFSRTLFVQLFSEIHTGPRTPGNSVQNFPTEMVALQGMLFGDPDFDTFQISAGSGSGMPSTTGETTLTDNGNGTYQVDSFFDVVYRIDFQGAPGSQLEGMSGTTMGDITMGVGTQPSTNVPALSTPAWLALAGLMLGATATVVRRRR